MDQKRDSNRKRILREKSPIYRATRFPGTRIYGAWKVASPRGSKCQRALPAAAANVSGHRPPRQQSEADTARRGSKCQQVPPANTLSGRSDLWRPESGQSARQQLTVGSTDMLILIRVVDMLTRDVLLLV